MDDDGDEEGDGDAPAVNIVVVIDVVVVDAPPFAVAVLVVVAVVVCEPVTTQRLRNCRNVAVVESGSDCSGDGSVMCGVLHSGCGEGSDPIVDGGVSTVGGGCKLQVGPYCCCCCPIRGPA